MAIELDEWTQLAWPPAPVGVIAGIPVALAVGPWSSRAVTSEWVLEDRVPTPAEHRRLAEAVGWHDAFDWESLPASLAGSSLGVVARVGTSTIGMGRAVGDGVKYFYLQDVAVDPVFQGRGVGRGIVTRLVELVALRAPAPAFVALFATPAGEQLYRSLGFGPGDMTGLFTIVEPRDQVEEDAAARHPGSPP